MGVLQLLASDNFITYSKVIANSFGVNSAVLLGVLCSYQNGFKNEEFYKEQYKISEDTCLSEYEIQQSLKVLKSNDIIKIIKKGMPAKNYYKVNEDKLFNILTTSGQKFRPLVTENLDHIYNNNNNNISKDITKKTNNKKTNNKKKKESGYDKIINSRIENKNLKNNVYEFIKMRNLIKKPMTDNALELMLIKLKELSKSDDIVAINILQQSILNCWQGIYKIKSDFKNTVATNYSQEDLKRYEREE